MDLLDLVYPKRCLECGQGGQYICSVCLSKLTKFHSTNSLWPYAGVIRKAILKLKYNFALDIAGELAQVVVKKLWIRKATFPNDPILVPVPLHVSRENFRGFNQSAEIAKLVAEGIGWRFVPDLLIRKTSTISQTGLSKVNRAENVKNVFVFNQEYDSLADDSCFIVFDDVFTTGSTLNEAKKVLINQGFKNVLGLTIAG